MQYEARCWSHFGSGFSLWYPEFTPPGLSLCWCAILQRWYLSCKGCNISVYLCLSGWLGTVQVDLWSSACIYPTPQTLKLWKWRTKLIHHATCDKSRDVWVGTANQRQEFTQPFYILLIDMLFCKKICDSCDFSLLTTSQYIHKM